jgi:hypothetical protein
MFFKTILKIYLKGECDIMRAIKDTKVEVIVRDKEDQQHKKQSAKRTNKYRIIPKKVEYEGVLVTKEMYEWKNFFTQGNQQKEEEFRELFYECDCSIFKAVFKCRERLMDDARYKFTGEMLECIERCDNMLLKDIIELIFGEPLYNFDEFMRIMIKNSWTWQRVLTRHNREYNKYDRFFAIVSLRYDDRLLS